MHIYNMYVFVYVCLVRVCMNVYIVYTPTGPCPYIQRIRAQHFAKGDFSIVRTEKERRQKWEGCKILTVRVVLYEHTRLYNIYIYISKKIQKCEANQKENIKIRFQFIDFKKKKKNEYYDILSLETI